MSTSLRYGASFTAAFLIAGMALAESVAYPPPAPAADPSVLGQHIQRTMTLLATSTPQHRNRVKILFYGQSITEQEWSKQVADDLRRRFPNADLVIENRAIGGFASQLLIWPAEHDLYPFYPDLLIFQVYGANQQYEQIIKSVRSRTTTEVLMQLDHVGAKWPQETPDEKADKGMWWDWMMNHVFLPDIAKKYGCGLVDVRSGWLKYLKDNNLQPPALLKDGIHLNDHGNFVMSHLINQYLIHRPDLPREEWHGLAKTFIVGKDLEWKDGKLSLEFDGNRIDAIAAARVGAAGKPTAQIRIDGKKPSEFPDCYAITRPQPGPWSPLAVTRVDHDQPLLLEDWTMKITEVNPDSTTWKFDVSGSITGPDGSGNSTALFTSQSGRVRISPEAYFRHGNVPVGYEIHWKVIPMFTDNYTPAQISDTSHEYPTVLAQGLKNARHTLEMTVAGGATFPLDALRAYKPPVAAQP